ncbi:response regulator [Lutibacter sp. A64]|uniref:response regulator n=1 Tax=Lutibacter sp. A64 TaxID=2918526 RepID=UPI001F052DDE|nr:response regulator [Lutibacter sp. A64]UMB53918.1 response regulator [Lutibacter sp. A64]
MKKELKVLIIEDHPMILQSYKDVLLTIPNYKFSLSTAANCSEAIRLMNKSKFESPIDLFLIDIQIDPSEDGKITSGEDLALYARKEFPESKIIILTAIDNTERLKSIIKNTPHNALMIKTDIVPKTLFKAFGSVMNSKQYYSKKIQTLKVRSLKNEDLLDEVDKRILFHLSKGVKTKDLVNFIDLKLSMIEKRKSVIKQIFNVIGSDAELLKEAEKRGFI